MFFTRFKQLCDESGTNPTRVCKDLLDIPKSTVSYWKNTKGFTPDINIIDAIAEHFDVSSDWLRCKTNMRKPVRTDITDNDIKFALFGGEVDDSKLNEVKAFAEFIKKRDGLD